MSICYKNIQQSQAINKQSLLDFDNKQMSEVIGGLKVNKLIWLSTCLTLGALFICWNNCDKKDPTIMDTAMEYPYTIIFRVGMMYSLFIYFLVFMFIKWWLDSSQFTTMTKPITWLGTLGLLTYALFVACIDRAKINYALAKTGVFFSSIFISTIIYIIMGQLKKIRKQTPLFIGETSWNLKKITASIQAFGMILAVLFFIGQIDVSHRSKIEYLVVISTILFFWTFVFDFKRFKMDIDRIPKAKVQPIILNQVNIMPQNNFNAASWNGQHLNSFESVELQQQSAKL